MSARQKAWVERFKYWACITKSPDAQSYDQAKDWAKGSGWFWRDVLTSAMAGKLIEIKGETKITTPTCMIRRTIPEALAANISEVVTFQSMVWDNNNFWFSNNNPQWMRFKAPGLYLIGAYALFDNTATDKSVDLRLRLNGVTNFPLVRGQDITNNDISPQFMQPWYFHEDDYLEMTVASTVATSLLECNMWAVAITPETIF